MPSRPFAALSQRVARARRRAAFEARRITARLVREVQALAHHTMSPMPPMDTARDPVRVAFVLPGSATPEMLGDALNRMAFTCGAASPARVAHLELEVHVPEALVDVTPQAPSDQPDYLDRLPARLEQVALGASLARADHVVLWRASSLMRATVLRALDRVHIMDPTFFRGTELSTAQRIQREAVDNAQLDEHDALTRRNFERLLTTHRHTVAYAVGTGPSLRDLENTGDRPVIGCNSLVLYEEFMERLRPTVVCFADEMVFAANPRGHDLRTAAERAAARYGTFFVVPPDAIGPLLRHHPSLAEHLIAIAPRPVPWRLPDPDEPIVRATWNVMTMHVLPVASALADTVRIAGCDGRDPNAIEADDWGHAATEPTPLDTTRAMHRALYRDMDYDSRIADHYEQLEQALTAWEALGKRYEAVTHSFVPALSRRRTQPQSSD